jgi:hypothetical protein
MLKRFRTTLGLTALLLAVPGCDSLTGPQLLTDFEWGEVEEPANVQERILTSVVLGELYVLGQMQTPTRCYSIGFDFSQSGSQLTLRISAKPGNSPNCDQSLGAYRYTLTVHNLEHNTYNLRVFHDITGAEGGQFTETVVIR